MTRPLALITAALLGLTASQSLAAGPAYAPIGSPCFCAQVCSALGADYSVWTDPAGQQTSMAACPPVARDDMWRHGRLCSCHSPLDWYKLQNQLRPPGPSTTGAEKPPYKGP